MRSKLIFFVVVISLVLIVFSCSDKKPTEPDTSADIIYSDNTVVVPDDVSAGIVEVTDDHVIISTEVVSVDDYQIGDILLSKPAENAPYGFLRKIEEIILQENQIVYETSLATLEDAFYQLKISESRRLKTTDVIDAQPMVDGVEFLPDSRNPFDFSFNIDTSFDLGNNVSFDIDGSLVATMGYHFDVEIDWLLRLKTIEFEPFVTADSDLTVTVNGGFSYEQEIVLYELRFGVITFGPIPTTPNISIILKIDANGGAAVTTSITCNADASINLTYQQGNWSSSYDRNINYDSSPPSLSSNLTLSVGAGPRLDILVFDVAGPYLIPLGYLNFDANTNQIPWWELYGGYKATIGVRGRIFSINLFNYEIVDIINYSFLIAQAEISTVATPTFNPPGGTYSSTQSVSISCATEAATIRYTTDGSNPTGTSSIYNEPIEISSDTTLKARAYMSGWEPSQIATAYYNFNIGSYQVCDFPTLLLGEWYLKVNNIWNYSIRNIPPLRIRTANRFYWVQSSHFNGSRYRIFAVREDDGVEHTFFFENVTSTTMDANKTIGNLWLPIGGFSGHYKN